MKNYQASVSALLTLLRDGQKGFQYMSELMLDTRCRAYMLEESYMRQCFATELENLLSSYVDEPVHASGTVVGTLHRAWLDLRHEFGASDEALLATLDHCEETAIKAYETALAEDSLPEPLRVVIERQLRHVRPLRQRISYLCMHTHH